MLAESMTVGESAKRAGSRARVVLLSLLVAAFCSLAIPAASFASSPPTIESVSVSGITEHGATLEAQIDTQGRYTGYWFQIDTNSSYDFTQADCPFEFPGDAECDSITDGEPLPAELVEPHPEYIQAGSGSQSVKLDLASIGATLWPATTYHYRVLVSSGSGPTVVYPDQTFETLGTFWSPPVPIEPPPVNRQIEKEFEEHPPWDRVPPSPPAEAATGVVTKGGVLPKPKALTTAQKLAEALKACKREPKRKQANCRKQAEKKYATAATKTG